MTFVLRLNLLKYCLGFFGLLFNQGKRLKSAPRPGHNRFLGLSAGGPNLNSPSRTVLLASWLAFTTLIGLAYESNLRAYLMAIDYEPPINTNEVRRFDDVSVSYGLHKISPSGFGEKWPTTVLSGEVAVLRALQEFSGSFPEGVSESGR